MRLLGILSAALLLLAALTFGYERRLEITDRLSERIEGFFLSDRSEVDAAPLGLKDENLDSAQAIISMREAGSLNTLVGFPDFARARFDLPKTVRARSGELVLEVAGTLNEDADAVLRLSVNGMRRTTVLLNRGSVHRKVILPLNTRDLAAKALNVTFSMEGRSTGVRSCGLGGAVLQVLPSSHLSLQLLEPETDPQDKLLLAGAPARLAWPTSRIEDQATVLATAFGITQSVGDVLLASSTDGSPALRLADIKALDGTLPAVPVRANIDTANLAANLGQRRVQNFSDNGRWRMNFDLDRLTGKPQAVDLGLTFGSAKPSDTAWLMSVFLNDRLIHAQRTDGNEGSLERRLALPQSLLRRSNVLSVSFQSNNGTGASCSGGTPSVAELGTAKLITVDTSEPKPLVELAALLKNGANLHLNAAVDMFDGQRALDALSGLSDLGLDIALEATTVSAMGDADITVVTKKDLQDFLKAQAGGETSPTWLAYYPQEEGAKITTHPITAASVTALVDLPDMVLIINAAGKGRNL